MIEFSPFTDESPEDFESPTPEEIRFYKAEAEYWERRDQQAEEAEYRERPAEEDDEAEQSPPPSPPSSEGLPMLRYMINERNERREAAIRKQMAVQQIIVKHANQIREELAADTSISDSPSFAGNTVTRPTFPARTYELISEGSHVTTTAVLRISA